MKQKHADGAAAFVVGLILLIGGFATWQAYQQWVALSEMDGHMGTSITAMHGTHPAWYLVGTILAAGVISGLYLGVRNRIGSPNAQVGASDGSEDGSDAKTQVEDDALEATQTAKPERPILDFLPDDERRILHPVLTSPGLTQIELRDRSDFSKSKVSQTVTDLEKRGLLYREPQGRTYRVYPSDELKHNRSQFLPPE